ncbi:MAG TPA: autotransporter domain-containing protein [Herbaspirillum sp.]
MLRNDGVIISPLALQNNGSIASLVNTGQIFGNIVSTSETDLSITGSGSAVFGQFRGFTGSPDTITNTASNVVFASGNIYLDDHINVGSHAVNVDGATLLVTGPINIFGNYNQGAAAILQIGVDTDGSSGSLDVSGSAVVAGGSTVVLEPHGYSFAQGQRYVVLQAANAGTDFNDDALNASAIDFGGTVVGSTVVEGGKSYLVLTLQNNGGSAAVTNLATTYNASASLGGILNYSGINANMLNLFDAVTAIDSSAAANRAGDQLSPSANTAAAVESAAASTTEVQSVIGSHMDGLRLAQAQGISGLSGGDSVKGAAVWGQAFGGQADQGMREGLSGYRGRYNGVLLGADRQLNDNLRLGGLFSYANTSATSQDNNAGSSAHVLSYGLMGYGGYTADRWYMDFSAGAVRHRFDTVRAVELTGFSDSAKGRFNGMQYVAAVRAGYPIKLQSNTTLTPIAGLGYSALQQDAYAESSSNGAALSVDSGNTTSVRSELAVKLERVFASSYGDIVPSVQLGWRHQFNRDAQKSVARFVSDPDGSTGFTSVGAAQVADTGVLALGVTLLHTSNLSLSAKYTLESASHFVAQSADLRMRYAF